jgi:AAA domain, putative AbiEii toxin, Type IV TA system
VDEPELSLHPTWQAGILPFYDSIVTQTAEKRSQVIVATHSPFVVHGSPTAKHVILRRDQGTGRISVDAAPAYPGVTSADVAVAAFDLEELGIGVPTKPIVMIVEGPTDRAILDVAWTKLYPGCEQPFVFHSAGNARAVQQLLGSSEIGKAGPVLDAASSTGTLGAIGLFDFDGEGFGHWNGTIKLEHAEEVSVTGMAPLSSSTLRRFRRTHPGSIGSGGALSSGRRSCPCYHFGRAMPALAPV